MSGRGTVGVKDRGRVLELPSGNDAASGGAGVAPQARARFRLNMVTSQVEVSVNTNAYQPLVTGSGASPWEQNGTVVSLDDAAVTQVQVDAQLAAFDDPAVIPSIPADQQVWARRVPANGAGAVISGRSVGEGATGERSAPVFLAVRERVADSPDIWTSAYVYDPEPSRAGDIGVDVGFHAWPRDPADPKSNTGIAFQADAEIGGPTWAQVVQAYEQDLKMRCVSFATGPGKDVLIQADGGIGAGNKGGDIFLEPTGGAVNGTDPTGSVICQPKMLENMSATTGAIFEARAQPDVQPGVSFIRASWLGFEAPAAVSRTGERSDSIAASQNDYDPGGDDLLHVSVLRVDNTDAGSINITGLRGGRLGRRVTLMNVSADPANTIVLTNEDAASTAANRFLLPGGTSLTVQQNAAVELIYDDTSSRWRVMVPA